MATEEQTDVSRLWSSLSATTSWGQRLTISNRVVTKLSFYLKRVGTPGGTLSFKIYKVSDSSLVVEKLWGNSNDIDTTAAWYEVTFDTPTLINEQVYLMVIATAGAASNLLNIYDSNGADVKASENMVRRVSGVYSAYPVGSDFGYKYTYEVSSAPTVTTQVVTGISGTTAIGNGNITDLGAPDPTQHGVCYVDETTYDSGNHPPTVADSKTEEGAATATGAFTSTMTVTAGTKYYVKAYATNSVGTSYGGIATFTADKGTVYPAAAITRVTQLIHRYNRATGEYNLEMQLGEVDVDIGLPYVQLSGSSSNPQKQEEAAKEKAKAEIRTEVRNVVSKPKTTPEVVQPVSAEPGAITRYAAEVIRRKPYQAAAITQQVQQVPSRPTVYAYNVLAQREQEVQRLEESQAAARLKTGKIATERTKAIITSSPEAQKRLAEVEESRKNWWEFWK